MYTERRIQQLKSTTKKTTKVYLQSMQCQVAGICLCARSFTHLKWNQMWQESHWISTACLLQIVLYSYFYSEACTSKGYILVSKSNLSLLWRRLCHRFWLFLSLGFSTSFGLFSRLAPSICFGLFFSLSPWLVLSLWIGFFLGLGLVVGVRFAACVWMRLWCIIHLQFELVDSGLQYQSSLRIGQSVNAFS